MATRGSATSVRPGSEATTRSPIGRWALVCRTCSTGPLDLCVLSVAEPVGFSGEWLYPHVDHARHELVTIDPDGRPMNGALLADLEEEPPRLKPGPAPRPDRPITHGTLYGYRMHLDRGEKACTACLEANAARQRAKYVRKANQRTYVCTTCDRSLNSRSALASHTWVQHDRAPIPAERIPRTEANA